MNVTSRQRGACRHVPNGIWATSPTRTSRHDNVVRVVTGNVEFGLYSTNSEHQIGLIIWKGATATFVRPVRHLCHGFRRHSRPWRPRVVDRVTTVHGSGPCPRAMTNREHVSCRRGPHHSHHDFDAPGPTPASVNH